MKRYLNVLGCVCLLVLAILFTAPAVHADAPAQTPFNRATDRCPCCGQVVTAWTELPNITSNSNLAAGHYVVSAPLNLGAYYNITGNKKVVILVESTLTAKNGSNALRAGVGASSTDVMTQLWLLGGANGKITGTGMTGTSGATTRNGGLMRFGPTSTVVIGGALTVEQTGTATNGRGGLFDVYGSNVTMIGGTLNGITSSASVDTYGAVVVRAGGVFNMTGGVINGGTVSKGGAIDISAEGAGGTVTISGNAYINCAGKTVTGNGAAINFAKGTLTIEGGTIIGGNAPTGGAIYMEAGQLNITGGTISGGTTTGHGGNIYMADGTLNMSGGTVSGGSADRGGNIFTAKGTMNLSGGTISDGTGNRGGNLYVGSVLNMSGGTISGGTATQYAGNIFVATNKPCAFTGGSVLDGVAQGSGYLGGNIHIYSTQVTISDTAAPMVISGGSAYQGGNISLSQSTASVSVNLTSADSIIANGTATEGGNIYNKGSVTLTSGTISGGTASSNGGNICMTAGSLTLEGATVTGGSAKNGGCVYVYEAAEVTMSAGEMKLGTATAQGAIGFIKGTLNMSGGTVTANGSASCNARGFRVHGGAVNLSGTANIISCAKSTGDGLNVVSVAGTATVTLDGNAQVWSKDSDIRHNIVFHNYSDGTNYVPTMLTVKSGWTGKASVRFGHITDGLDTFAPGGAISSDYASSEGSFQGQLYLENDGSLPRIYGKGQQLVFAGVEVQTLTGYAKKSYWYESNAQAVAAYGALESEYKCLRLYTDDDLDLAGNELYVDFNGHSVKVCLSGGKLYGQDSSATTEEAGTAAVTITDGKAELYGENPVTGVRTIALAGESTTFHPIKVDITAATVRPGAAGLYYTARIACDDTLKSYVESFGVAASLVQMPSENFRQETHTQYVSYNNIRKSSYNGVLIQNIMKSEETPEENRQRAEKPIYANAFLQLNLDGQPLTLMAKTTGDLSMKTVIQRINGMWSQLTEKERSLVAEKLYDAFVAEFADDWNLYNIEAYKAGTAVTKELKILTIGNSLSVDATRMLAYIALQEGSQGVKIGTLYHANCSLQEHADFLTNDKAEYWYYESGFDANTAATLTEGSLVPKETKSYIGKDAIVAEDWDIIIMQHAVFQSGDPETYDDSIDTIIRYVNAHKTNPNAVFAWNMTWMGPVDADLLATASSSSPGFDTTYKNYTKNVLDREAQTMMYRRIVSAVESKIANSGRFVYLLPSATMMQNALNATSDKVMYRDYIHGSDYGRLMNGYLWYSILTGKTITEPVVTEIPGALRFAEADRTSDLPLTQRQQAILVEAVNNAIENPFEATASAYSKKGELNVLAIGNSFAQDATYYLDDIARAQGYTDVNIAYLFIGGCTLKTHAAKMNGNLADYDYYTNFDGSWVKTASYTMEQAITSRKWDVVTLQQGSPNSGQSSTYEPYLGQLVTYIQQKQPDAKILWHMTWAYQSNSTHSGFANYNKNQMTMYNAIVDAYNTAVMPYIKSGDMTGVLACGTAIQNARTSYVGDTLTRDGYHMSPLGRYLTGCLWYSILTGEELTELDLTKADSKLTLTARDKAMVVEAVNNAIANPTAVTPSTDPN